MTTLYPGHLRPGDTLRIDGQQDTLRDVEIVGGTPLQRLRLDGGDVIVRSDERVEVVARACQSH